MQRHIRIYLNKKISITPSLHKLSAHSSKQIRNFNDGYGMKKLSEECIESVNKHVRRYREKLARKTPFQDNINDIFVRLLTQSAPVLLQHRRVSEKSVKKHLIQSEQDALVKSFLLESVTDDDLKNGVIGIICQQYELSI